MSKQQYEQQMSVKRTDFLEKGYELFSTRTIEAVNLTDVADASAYGIATLYRYFRKKPGFVVAVAAWKWEQIRQVSSRRESEMAWEGKNSAELLEAFLEFFLKLYREYPDLLRFNRFFNIYVQSENLDPEVMAPYHELIRGMEKAFGIMYKRAEEDGKVRTDMPEEEMFSLVFHLMMAAVTRYAVGLDYTTGSGCDALRELTVEKDMLLDRFLVR